MRQIMVTKFAVVLIALIALSFGTVPATAAVTNLSIDVAQSIDDGLAQLDALGAYNYPACSAGDATGLTLLALMEKRPSGDPDDPAQGYSSATPADQARMENAAHCILGHATANFFSYRDGQDMMALSLYERTGGPQPAGWPTPVIDGINLLFDRSIANQGAHGYWCYVDGSCLDASTTQFIVNGLAAVSAIYSVSDPARLATLNAALALTRSAYASANQTGGPGGACDALERGHGYNRMNAPGDSTGLGSLRENTLQQTSAGTFAQLVGGADLNDPSVQEYLRWIFNHYRFDSTFPHEWNGLSYYYFLWASTKTFEFIEASGVAPNPGNLTVADMGTSAAGTCANNQENRDPATDSQVARFGAGGAGYYSDHPAGFYYDYAYTLLNSQTGVAGTPGDYTGNGKWNPFSGLSYAILVLQRSVGGAPPSGINADIDIKFCSNPNGFNCKGGGVMPMTVFGSAELDVSQVDLETVELCLADDDTICIGADSLRDSNEEDRGDPTTDIGAAQCAINEETGEQERFLNPDFIMDLELAWDKRDVVEFLFEDCDGFDKKEASPTLIFKAMTLGGEEITSTPIGDPGIDQIWRQK